MNVIDPGHEYLLDSLDGGEPVPLTFVKREGRHYPGNIGNHPGTTMQEVLRALIDRARYVNGQIKCAETEAAIGLMEAALLLFELRAARCHRRFLEVPLSEVIGGYTCRVCGHIRCAGNHSEDRKP